MAHTELVGLLREPDTGKDKISERRKLSLRALRAVATLTVVLNPFQFL